jgi:hypothetical protein
MTATKKNDTKKTSTEWFEADRKGLANVVAGRDVSFVVYELLQNALDEDGVEEIFVGFEKVEEAVGGRRALYELSVLDDSPDGFADLRESFVLFAPSKKTADATKRGRFNSGEKFAIARSESARISSTTGTIEFDATGRTSYPRRKRETGTLVALRLRLTKAEAVAIEFAARAIILTPDQPDVSYNGDLLPAFEPIATTEGILPTVLAEAPFEPLRKTRRSAEVYVFEAQAGEGRILELGIPICETGDPYDVSIGQKVPLGTNRESVTPGYLRRVRALVANALGDDVGVEESRANWAIDALSSDAIEREAVGAIVRARFGPKALSYDVSDREANNRAVERGYSIVHGGSLPREAWRNVRDAEALSPAGKVVPTARPYHPDGDPLRLLDREPLLADARAKLDRFEALAKSVAKATLDRSIEVVFADDPGWGFAGTYGPSGKLTVNYSGVRRGFFDDVTAVLDFLVHEFGHEFESNHLSTNYFRSLTKIGAKLAVAVSVGDVSLDGFLAFPIE